MDLNHRNYMYASRTFDELEREALKLLPTTPYRFAEWKKAKVNIDYHIEIRRHYYSVPYQLVGQSLDVRLSERTVEVFQNHKLIVTHTRDDSPGRHTTTKEHMPAEHRYMQDWTPSRFLDWATSIGPETKTQINSMLLSRKYPEQAYRACLGLLHLSKKFSAARLEAACKKANAHGIISMRSIKSMLTTGSDKLDDKQASLVINHSNIRGDTQFH